MSRFKRFAHSLVSGYVLMVINTVYSLASVPLALKYLDKTEFGLWAVVSSIAQYVGLIDMGMIGTSRILVDYKDRKNEGQYGSLIQTFLLVSAVQGGLIILLSLILPFALVPALRIEPALEREFIFLTMGQCALLGAGFLTRLLTLLLGAHQRYDLINYPKAILFALSLAVLWIAFTHQQGVYSTLWAQGAWFALDTLIALGLALKLRLFPPRGCWGRPSWERFREIFNFGRDLFLVTVGAQLLGASQALVLTRVLGAEAAGLWYACTRSYTVVTQLIFRIFDYSGAALAEMIVRGEKALLYQRVRGLIMLSASLAVWAGAIFAVANQPFVSLFTQGKFSWSPWNDVLLAVALVIQTVSRADLGFGGQTKEFHFYRYVYIVEGAFFIAVSLLVLRNGGVTGMLLVTIVGGLLFSSFYGAWRTKTYFGLSWADLWRERWMPPVRLALLLAPLAWGTWWLVRGLRPRAQFVICPIVLGLLGAPLFLRFGLGKNLRAELLDRIPVRLRPLVFCLARI